MSYRFHSIIRWVGDKVEASFEWSSFDRDSGGRVTEIMSVAEFQKRFGFIPKRETVESGNG